MSHMDRIRSATGVAWCAIVVGAMLLAAGPSTAGACNTPVFRYAMYNWPAAPYYVFYFHHGQPDKEDEAVNKMLDELYEADPPANVALSVVDVSDKKQFEPLPEVVKKAYQSHADGRQPCHVVFSSWGVKQSVGRLDAKTVKAMIDSPVRKRLGELFHKGNAAVLLILTGPDQQANQRAEKVAGDVVQKAAAEIPVGGGDDFGPPQFPPQAPGDDTPAEEQPDDADETLKLAVLKVARSDPTEKWLVDMLLSIEPDLREEKFAKEPMIFAVYGRGRAMPPYVGKGITTENLIDCVAFLSGPCSCMIKDQNPGMDLLMHWDWDATAEVMAANDKSFDSGPFGYREYSVDDTGTETESPAAEETAPEAPPAGNNPSEAPVPQDNGPQAAATSEPGPKNLDSRRVEQARPEVPKTAEAPDDVADGSQSRPATGSFAAGQVWKLGLGLAVGAVVVLAIGMVLIGRQRPA